MASAHVHVADMLDRKVSGGAAELAQEGISLLSNRETAFFRSGSGVPAATVAPPEPTYLVVVADFDVAQSLAAASVQARRAGARLLIALARSRCGFTTDAAIAERVVARRRQEMLDLERLAHQVLDRTGVAFDTVLMTYGGGGTQPGSSRRMCAAMNRLARRHGATQLPTTDHPSTAHHASGLRADVAVTPDEENNP